MSDRDKVKFFGIPTPQTYERIKWVTIIARNNPFLSINNKDKWKK